MQTKNKKIVHSSSTAMGKIRKLFLRRLSQLNCEYVISKVAKVRKRKFTTAKSTDGTLPFNTCVGINIFIS